MTKTEQLVSGETTPLIRWSLIAGFFAWGSDLGFSYVLEQHACSTGHHYVLHAISLVCILLAISGFLSALSEFRRFRANTSEEGGRRLDRTHFQALIGMAFSLSFAIVILAAAIPRWILSACE